MTHQQNQTHNKWGRLHKLLVESHFISSTFIFNKLSYKTTRKPSACFKLVTAFLFFHSWWIFDAQNCLGFWQKGSANKRTQLSGKFAVFIYTSIVSPLVIFALEWAQRGLGWQQTGIRKNKGQHMEKTCGNLVCFITNWQKPKSGGTSVIKPNNQLQS